MQNMDYYQISAEELGKNSKIPILKLSDSGEVFYELALEMKETIEKNNQAGRHTVFICPVGPVGQYPIFVRLVNRDRVSLKNCWFINMDEYLNDDETYISEDSPLSFRGFMKRSVYEKIDPELVMPQEQRIFPDPKAPEKIHEIITRLGGEFAKLPTRVLTISRETRTSNAIGDRSGAIDAMPKKAVTIGISEILAARKVRIGVFRDWHRAVIRQAAYGEVSGHFPASLLQRHADAMIITNANAAKQPF